MSGSTRGLKEDDYGELETPDEGESHRQQLLLCLRSLHGGSTLLANFLVVTGCLAVAISLKHIAETQLELGDRIVPLRCQTARHFTRESRRNGTRNRERMF